MKFLFKVTLVLGLTIALWFAKPSKRGLLVKEGPLHFQYIIAGSCNGINAPLSQYSKWCGRKEDLCRIILYKGAISIGTKCENTWVVTARTRDEFENRAVDWEHPYEPYFTWPPKN